jgi:UDP-glucose 4-epimerase
LAPDGNRVPGRYVVVGGAGFIGSHFVDALLDRSDVAAVTIYDNFSSGRAWHYQHRLSDARLRVVRGEVENLRELVQAMEGHDVVIHLASNPDIARAITDPSIDFHQGTALTHRVVEAMRMAGTKSIVYASGSGVYGELGEIEAEEDRGRLHPISTYGASKLAGEALISSYCFMFGLSGRVFRFGNVVGPRQTHGVGLDFARRLLSDSTRLAILGDGQQSKSYIHVSDVVSAVLLALEKGRDTFQVYNVATGDYITVREIADIAAECVGLAPGSVRYEYSGGDRGWKGDVPVVRLNTARICGLGWRCQRPTRQAIRDSITSMLSDLRGGRM